MASPVLTIVGKSDCENRHESDLEMLKHFAPIQSAENLNTAMIADTSHQSRQGSHSPIVIRNPPGRAEAFVEIEIRILGVAADFDRETLDRPGRKRLQKATNGRACQAFSGVAKVAWKNGGSRSACVKDHEKGRRNERWRQVEEYAARMMKGEFPRHGSTYFIGRLTGESPVTVIDGTRRMLAYLESGHTEMPVVVLVGQDEAPTKSGRLRHAG